MFVINVSQKVSTCSAKLDWRLKLCLLFNKDQTEERSVGVRVQVGNVEKVPFFTEHRTLGKNDKRGGQEKKVDHLAHPTHYFIVSVSLRVHRKDQGIKLTVLGGEKIECVLV